MVSWQGRCGMAARHVVGGIVVGLLLAGPALAGPEPWADPKLPAAEGLVLWLDAAAQTTARQKLGKAPVGDGALLDVWYDASGSGRHLSQPVRDLQPSFQILQGGHAVRFDGQDDFLSLPG